MAIDREQRQRIVASQRDAWQRFGFHPNALFWSNREIQEIRFRILLEAGMHSGESLLDVGCGFGDFSAWLAGHCGELHRHRPVAGTAGRRAATLPAYRTCRG
ncbi:hypothetical protein [Thiolapillus sp.]|uniref:hypothetical protein n=1 Tax=Thiolapillus sp. TaxID=2017437 RepID=UPI003AF56948